MNPDQHAWAKRLFKKSVLKQAKWQRIRELLPPLQGKRCLDIGADNGVISLLLRELGGQWSSADLDPTAVRSIAELVGQEVYQISGEATPFVDNSFDLVVIVDFLEHTHSDAAFVRDLERILKPGGRLIVNVPHLKPYSLLNRLRHAIGLTDEKHGHVRPGYSRRGLAELLEPRFTVLAARTYSKTFSEAIDTALNFLYEVLQKKKDRSRASAKGTVVTAGDMKQYQKEFRLLSLLYPFLWMWSKLDWLMFWTSGYKLIMSAQMEQAPTPAGRAGDRGDQ